MWEKVGDAGLQKEGVTGGQAIADFTGGGGKPLESSEEALKVLVTAVPLTEVEEEEYGVGDTGGRVLQLKRGRGKSFAEPNGGVGRVRAGLVA